jgi:predicted MFS family arabinose efflux permease
VLRNRDFRLLIGGQAASTIGDRMVFVALALYVTDIGTPSDVGLVLAAHAVPLVGFLLIGGVWADRLPRHKVMIATDLIRFSLHAVLAALIFSGTVEIWHIVVIEALFGAAEAFFRPAYSGLVPQTVAEEQIQPAKAATSMVETIAEFAGPALATALVLGVGPGWAFAIDACTFLVSAALLLPLRPRERGAPAVRQTAMAELREGWSEVRSRTWVWVIIAAFSVALLACFGPWMTLGATVAEAEYDTRAVYGILAAALGAGTVAGSLIGFRWRPRHPMRAGMLLALPWPVAIGLFALGLPVAALVIVFVLAGGGIALFDVWWSTALAERIPPHTLSRVTAYDWMGSLALLPIGYALAGPVGEALGEIEVLAGGAVIALVALGAALCVRQVWQLGHVRPIAAATS